MTKYEAFMADYKTLCEKHDLRIYAEVDGLLYLEAPSPFAPEWDRYVLFHFMERDDFDDLNDPL